MTRKLQFKMNKVETVKNIELSFYELVCHKSLVRNKTALLKYEDFVENIK